MDNFIGGDLWDSIVGTNTNPVQPKGGTQSTTQPAEFKQAELNLDEQQNFVYPSNLLQDSEHNSFFVYRAYDLSSSTRQYYGNMRSSFTSTTKKTTTDQNDSKTQELLAVITLNSPLLQEELAHDFGEHATSVAADFVQNMMNVKGGDTIGETVSNVAGTAKSAGLQGAGGLVANMQRGLIESGQGGSAAQLRKSSTVLADYASTTAFKGTSLRTQTVEYTFNPTSVEELKIVGGILRTFMRLSLATRSQLSLPVEVENREFQKGYGKYATLLKTPPVWMIEEVSDDPAASFRYTPRFVFGPAGITSVRINRTPDQYWKTFVGSAGDSASIVMEVTFTELIPMDRDVYDADLKSSIRGYTGE
ncbi:baseplate tail tube cap [Vibrio phage D479]